jgi:hypothetical protein
MDNDRPPLLGIVGRTAGHIRTTVCDNTQQITIQLQVETAPISTGRLINPAAVGSENGRCLVAWSESLDSPEYWDVFGRRVAPYWIYLPAVLKNR